MSIWYFSYQIDMGTYQSCDQIVVFFNYPTDMLSYQTDILSYHIDMFVI